MIEATISIFANRRRDRKVDVCGNGNSDGGARSLFLIDCLGRCPRLRDLKNNIYYLLFFMKK